VERKGRRKKAELYVVGSCRNLARTYKPHAW
jgi:hypothetical protein